MLHGLSSTPVHKLSVNMTSVIDFGVVVHDDLALLKGLVSLKNGRTVNRVASAIETDTTKGAILVLLSPQLLVGSLILVPCILLQITHSPAIGDGGLNRGHSTQLPSFFHPGILRLSVLH